MDLFMVFILVCLKQLRVFYKCHFQASTCQGQGNLIVHKMGQIIFGHLKDGTKKSIPLHDFPCFW